MEPDRPSRECGYATAAFDSASTQIGGPRAFPLDHRYEGRRGHSLLGTSAGGDSLAAAPSSPASAASPAAAAAPPPFPPPPPPQSATTRGRKSPAMEATCTTAVHTTALATARMAHRHARLRRAPPPPTATIPGGRGLQLPTSQLVPPPSCSSSGSRRRRRRKRGEGERPSRGQWEGSVREGKRRCLCEGGPPRSAKLLGDECVV